MFFYMEECLFLNEIVQRDKTSKLCVSIVYTETETYVTTFAPFLFFFPTFTSLLFNFYSCVCVCVSFENNNNNKTKTYSKSNKHL